MHTMEDNNGQCLQLTGRMMAISFWQNGKLMQYGIIMQKKVGP